MAWPNSTRRACSSNPVITGMWTSATRQDVSCRQGDCKKSCADGKVWTTNPDDLRSPLVASRTDSSSSMIEINALSGNAASGVLFETAAGEVCKTIGGQRLIERARRKMDDGDDKSHYTLV
jgi:hypothetical protein